MSRKEKLLRKIINNPKDVIFADLQKILEWDGWCIHAHNSTHYTYFRRGSGRVTIVRKGDGRVKEYYVKEVLRMMGVL